MKLDTTITVHMGWDILATLAEAKLEHALAAAVTQAREDTARDFARARVRAGVRPVAMRSSEFRRLPKRFTCPECGGRTLLEVDEWSTTTRTPTLGGFRVMCEAEDDELMRAMAEDEAPKWEHRHWQSDWMPLVDQVGRWIGRNVEILPHD